MPNDSMLEADNEQAFTARLVLQREKGDVLELIRDECSTEAFNQLTIPQLQSKLHILEDAWSSFKSNHDKLATEFPQAYVSSTYCTKKVFAGALSYYSDAHSAISSRIAAIQPAPDTTRALPINEFRPPPGTTAYQLFEKLKLRPFSGKYQDWKEFEDMFQALVGSSEEILPVHKMSVLKNSVQGEAARLISHMKTTGENYPVAWKLLESRYENKRLLVSAQLDKLFGASSTVSPTSQDLNDLLNGVREALDALKSLEVEFDTWDYAVVYHMVRRLDPTIRKEWERNLGSVTEYPSLKALQDFLKSEATSLESIELTSGGSPKLKTSSKMSSIPSSSKLQKYATVRAYATTAQEESHRLVTIRGNPTQFKKAPSTPSSTLKPWMKGARGPNDPGHICDCCGRDDHYIGACDKFKDKTPRARLQFTTQYKLCNNCLGRHHTDACRNRNRCRTCQGKHHSLLHIGESPQAPAQTLASSSTKEAQHSSPSTSPTAQTNVHWSRGQVSNGSISSSPASTSSSYLTTVSSSTSTTSSSSETTQIESSSLTTRPSISTIPSSYLIGHRIAQAPSHLVDDQPTVSPVHLAHPELLTQPAALLSTAQAQLVSPTSASQPIRLLLDSGSELSFITNQLVLQLKLQRHRSSIQLTGFANVSAGKSKGVCIVTLRSLYSDEQIQVPLNIMTSLTSILPRFHVDSSSWPHLKGLQLADPDYQKPGHIDIILGSIHFSQVVRPEFKLAQSSAPIAIKTIFGWVIFGPTNRSLALTSSPVLHVQQDHALHDLLSRFWLQEESHQFEVPNLTPDEEHCEAHFANTHTRDGTGRYVVRLPIVPSPQQLGESRNTALRCLKSMLKRLSKDQKLNQLYRDFMKEYEVLGHMRLVPEAPSHSESGSSSESGERLDEMTLAHDTSVPGGLRVSGIRSPVQASSSPHYYLPHHGVLKEQSLTTKLRVVFNGSAKTSSGYSLNDVLHAGAKLQMDIFDVLLWIRRHKIIFSSDISKMFRQINVHHSDWDLQRILWLDQHNNIVPYQLTTVTYGTRSAPFLAVRVLLQLVQDEGSKHPLAIAPMTKGRYVDDIFGGSDTLEEAQLIAQDLINLCTAGSFPLAKWSSNTPAFLEALSLESVSTAPAQDLDDTELKVLGLSWSPSFDQFIFSPKSSKLKKITKRTVLSEVAQLFDPLGFLAPVIVRAKMFIQELWLNKSGWDDELPDRLAQRWTHLRDEFILLAQIRIPRWINTITSSYIELHGFSDASQLAMSACIYIRVVNPREAAQVTLLCAKTKVAPLKPVTIPRLELTAAWLLSKLINHAQKILELAHVPLYLWTDSSVALTWILSHPTRWKEFVRNRVSTIQELNPTAKWHYVPGKQNPADCASRGLAPTQLANFMPWWNGPRWLRSSYSSWPAQQFKPSALAHKEERPGVLLHTTKTPSETDHPLWYLLSRYSSIYKLSRITALCKRFLSVLKKEENSSLTQRPLSPKDQLDAQLTWVKIIQQIHFSNEMKSIQEGLHLPAAHIMSRLTAFIDHNGVLRVGGRLQQAQLDPDATHPIILPRKSRLSYLLIAQAHLSTLHGGTQLTLIHLRQSFWIIGGRAPVRSFILKCVTCARYRAQRAQQLMGQLPASRVTPVRPFHTTGVDYAGPFSLKTFQGRGAKTYKGWIAVFVCFVTSAVHLEVVTDYSAEAFIKAYRRFVSRRGVSSVLYSDCGTTFQGANKFLKELFSSGSPYNTQLISSLAQEGTRWIFSPPGAPHFGGKWEAAVKSVKFHLVRVIGETLLTYEDFTTLLAQIEAVLNSRPLSALSDDPDDLNALTPAHFLTGSAPTVLPERDLIDLPESRLSLWQLVQQKLQQLWQRWSKECLQRYQAIAKWHHEQHQLKIGSLVLMTDERLPPARWPLARVIDVHPGKDGRIRVVTIKTATTTLTRPIVKLVVLPVDVFTNTVAEGGENVEKM